MNGVVVIDTNLAPPSGSWAFKHWSSRGLCRLRLPWCLLPAESSWTDCRRDVCCRAL